MRPLPTPPAPGKPVSATLIRQLIDAIRERTILPGRNTSVKRGPNGSVVNANTYSSSINNPSIPWTFSCKEDPYTGVRTGGWTNCRLQIGLECDWMSIDLADNPSEDQHIITGTDLTDDGDYFLVVDLAENTAAIMVKNEETKDDFKDFDPEHNKVLITLGTLSPAEGEGSQPKFTGRMHINPVIYKYV